MALSWSKYLVSYLVCKASAPTWGSCWNKTFPNLPKLLKGSIKIKLTTSSSSQERDSGWEGESGGVHVFFAVFWLTDCFHDIVQHCHVEHQPRQGLPCSWAETGLLLRFSAFLGGSGFSAGAFHTLTSGQAWRSQNSELGFLSGRPQRWKWWVQSTKLWILWVKSTTVTNYLKHHLSVDSSLSSSPRPLFESPLRCPVISSLGRLAAGEVPCSCVAEWFGCNGGASSRLRPNQNTWVERLEVRVRLENTQSQTHWNPHSHSHASTHTSTASSQPSVSMLFSVT